MPTSTSHRDTTHTDPLKSKKPTSFGSLVKHRLPTHNGFLSEIARLRHLLPFSKPKESDRNVHDRVVWSRGYHTIVEARHGHDIATSTALYYPSLIGNCWDDELLPSGD
jgi:hypothetical protein